MAEEGRLAEASPSLTRTDLMLLGLLSSQSMHGYEIAEYLDQPKMQAWVKLGRASIYYAFGRLEKQGYVTRHAERHGGKPERTVFSITDLGRHTFIDALVDALGTSENQTDAFDIALYFSSRIDSPRTEKRIGQRIEILGEQMEHLRSIADQSSAHQSDGELMLVLEHRLAVLRADMDFLAGYVQMLKTGKGASAVSGSLADVSLADVLHNLASSCRTGVFRITSLAGTVGLCFDQGRLYGVIVPQGSTLEASLQSAFSSSRGTYEFVSEDIIEVDAEPVGGLHHAILIGARGVTDEAMLARMLPNPETLLAVRDGYERDIIGIDLTAQERALLSEIDGARTLGEVAQALSTTTSEVKSAAYALWLAGWVVRVDRTKRDLVLAVAGYVKRWRDATRMYAGEAGQRRVFEDVDLAASAGGLIDFSSLEFGLQSARLAMSTDAVVEQARDYLNLLTRAVSARLGDGFAEDVASGYARQLSDGDARLLETHGIRV